MVGLVHLVQRFTVPFASHTAGWTNSAGSVIVNPGKLLASVVGSLTQPLFYRGSNIARLKIAKAQQEEAKLAFQQTVFLKVLQPSGSGGNGEIP